MDQRFPARVVVREVGLRDGLQSIPTILATERKREWIRQAFAAGQREIEIGSFVPARLLPQLADTGELLRWAKTLPGLSVSVLVPNLRGAEQAQVEADRVTANAHAQIEVERAQTLAQLKAEVGTIATSLAGRIVGESLDDDERQKRTVDRFIADLENSN